MGTTCSISDVFYVVVFTVHVHSIPYVMLYIRHLVLLPG